MKQRNLKMLALLLAFVMFCLPALSACNQTSSEIETVTGEPGRDGIDGKDGKDGVDGKDGKDGQDGVAGKSAYELAVEKGYQGTLEEWLESLVGEAGTAGQNGSDGKSAYELAVEKGYKGTLEEWLASLIGETGAAGQNGSDGKDGQNGAAGKSAYEIAVENGFKGTEAEWLASLVGAKGEDGTQGSQGEQGIKGDSGVGVANAYVNDEYHLILVLTDGNEVDAGYVGIPIASTTRGEWLHTLVEAMEYILLDLPEVPTFSDISETVYQKHIETAVQYGLLDLSADEFSPDDTATREFAIVTAIKAMGYVPDDDIVCTDIDDVQYPEYAQLAITLELVTLVNGKFLPNNPITASEKEAILKVIDETIHSISEPDGSEEGFVYKDDVVPLFSATGFSMTQTNDMAGFTEDGRLKLPLMEETRNLAPGQIISVDNRYAYKIVESTVDGDSVLIQYVEPEIHEVLDELDIAGTAYPIVSQFQPADGVTVISQFPQTYASGGGEFEPSLPPLAIELTIPWENGLDITIELDFSVASVEYLYDIDFRRVVPNVKNAYLIVHPEIEASVGISRKTPDGPDAFKWNEKFPPTKYMLGVLPFLGTDNFGVVAQINFVVSAEGSFSVTVEVTGDVGAQMLNNIPRVVNDLSISTPQAAISAEIKAGFELQVLAEIFRWSLISFDVEAGASAKGESVLRPDGMFCIDAAFAPYLEIAIFEDTLIDDWFNCSIVVNILENNENNPLRLNLHFENMFNLVDHCTYKENTDEDSTEETETETEMVTESETRTDGTSDPPDAEPGTSVASEGLRYVSNGDGTCYVIGIGNCSDLDVVIPDVNPDGYRVTSIGKEAFDSCSDLTSITIPDSVTSIGEAAFNGCTGLTSITIPDSVTIIDSYAFFYCTGLTSITIPDSVTRIGVCVFEICSSLTSITIPDSVTSIGNYAFRGCTNLRSIMVTNGNSIYHSAGNCLIETQSKTLLAGCDNSVIPTDGSVTVIYSDAFYYCAGLMSITIPDSVTSIGNSAFEHCSSLTSITIPDSVTSIGNKAFAHCSSLTSITIPDSVTSIGDSAFGNCSGLTSITIPDSVTSIGDSVFGNCSGLTSIIIPDSVTSISKSAFWGCSNLTSITIPDSVTSIGDYAFYECSGLTSITIPDSVTSIGDDAFGYCYGVTDVYYSGTIDQWRSIAIGSVNFILIASTIHCTDGDITL